VTRPAGSRRCSLHAAIGCVVATLAATEPVRAQSGTDVPVESSPTAETGAAESGTADPAAVVAAEVPSDELVALPTVAPAEGPNDSDAPSEDANDPALLAEGRTWYAREHAAGRGVPAWAGATGVEVPVGLELGVRLLVGMLLDDPAGFLFFDPYALMGPSWGARVHVGYAVEWFSARVEGGWMRHEQVGGEGTLVQGDHAATEIPLALMLRATLPDPLVGPYVEAGGGCSAWSVPVRVDTRYGTQSVELAWTPMARAAVGVRVLGYLDLFAEGALSGQDDLGGTGQLFFGPSWFVGGGVGAHFSGLTR
jgi:hypothetical protein